MLRHRTRWAAAAVTLLLLAGCGDDGSDPEAAGDEARSDATVVAPVEPKTPVAGGFTVVEGTTPIGPALPIGTEYSYGGIDVVDEGWTATFLVTGDLVAAVEGYLDQGIASGLTRRDAYDGIPCAPSSGATDVEVVECAASASGAGDLPNLTVVGQQGTAAGAAVSHLVLRWSQDARSFIPDAFGSGADAVPPGPPDDWAPLPEVGDPIGADLGGYPEQVRLEAGSAVAGPPLVAGPYLGQSAILSVTGDPAEVLARYRAQLVARYGADSVFDSGEEAGGATLTRVAGAEAGGDAVDVELVERPGEQAWITISGTHD